ALQARQLNAQTRAISGDHGEELPLANRGHRFTCGRVAPQTAAAHSLHPDWQSGRLGILIDLRPLGWTCARETGHKGLDRVGVRGWVAPFRESRPALPFLCVFDAPTGDMQTQDGKACQESET